MRLQIWACEPVFLQNYLAKVQNAKASDIETARAMFGMGDSDPSDEIYSEMGDEARIQVNGVLSQDGPPWIAKLFGFTGTAYSAILAGIARAEANPAISKLTLLINSPGGDAQGVDPVWQALQSSTKQTQAVNVGMMASAAYYIGCACDKITANAPNNETGSIGVYFAGIDDTDAMDQAGLKEVKVFGVHSTRKDSSVATKAGIAELQLRADAQERNFVARVAAGRGITEKKVNSKFGNGAVFVAEDMDPTKEDAMSLGLIDGLSPGVIGKANVQPDDDEPDDDDIEVETRARSYVRPNKPRSQISAPAEGEANMTLKEFLAANPQAQAEINELTTAAEAKGAARVQARVDAAKPYLSLASTKEGYNPAEVAHIGKLAVAVALGDEEAPALKSFVRMIDMGVESRKGTQAAAETKDQGETSPTTQDPGVMTQAVATLVQSRVNVIAAYATENKLDINAVLKAEMDHVSKLPARKGA